MSNEMGCYVASMKFGTTDKGMLYEQFCCIFQFNELTGGIEEKLIKD